jgi:hypothetical protein
LAGTYYVGISATEITETTEITASRFFKMKDEKRTLKVKASALELVHRP